MVNADGAPIERHVLDTQVFVIVTQRHTPPLAPQLMFDAEAVQWCDVIKVMRGLITKHYLTKLPPLPPGCSFSIAAYTLRDAPSSSVNPQLWVEELAGATGKCDVDLPDPFTVQIVKTVHLAGVAGLQLFVERPPDSY